MIEGFFKRAQLFLPNSAANCLQIKNITYLSCTGHGLSPVSTDNLLQLPYRVLDLAYFPYSKHCANLHVSAHLIVILIYYSHSTDKEIKTQKITVQDL